MMQEQSGTTPLLASEEEAPTSLSSSHNYHQHDEDEPSGFSRLMQLSSDNNNNNNITDHHYYNNPLAELAARYDPYYGDDSYLLVDGAHGGDGGSSNSATTPYVISVATGTLGLLHVGLVLSSLVADSWMSTGMQVDLRAWPQQSVSVQQSSLATVLQQLRASHHSSAAVLLWTTSLMIPCTFMVLAPSWIVGGVVVVRCNSSTKSHSNNKPSKLRVLLELSVRWALVIVFVEATMALVSQFVLLEWTGTTVSLQNTIGTGLACFAVGCVCAVALTVLLRWNQFHPTIQQQQDSAGGAVRHLMAEDTSVSDSMPPAAPRLQPVKTPPPHAFRHRLNDDDDDEEEASHRLQILEETPPVSPNRTTDEEEEHDPPAVMATPTAATTIVDPPPPQQPQPRKSLSFLHLLLVFQVGLLSILSLVPALVLPAVSIHFSGIASEFMPLRSHTVFLHQIPSLLLRHSGNNKATAWIGALLMVPTVIVPCIATILAVATWMRAASAKRAANRRWLYALHPAMGGVVAAAALLLAVAVLHDWNRYVFNDASLCDALESSIVGEPCLAVTVRGKTGAWFWALQSVLLEAFVVLTLVWS